MSLLERSTSPWTGRMLSILRIVTGVMFALHGTMKLFDFPHRDMVRAPLALASSIGIAGLLEAFGGVAIMLGLLTRPVAFLLAGQMAVAYFWKHHPKSFFPTLNGGEPAALYCFVFLYLMFAGGGPWGIDALIARRRRAAT
jgi:putative oxidoreductase